MNKLDELIARCEEGLNNSLGHNARLDLFRDTAAALRLLRDDVNDLVWIDAMPVDGCSPFVIEDMLRQAKIRAYTRLTALRAAGLMGGE